jgi:hypothetical protein
MKKTMQLKAEVKKITNIIAKKDLIAKEKMRELIERKKTLR